MKLPLIAILLFFITPFCFASGDMLNATQALAKQGILVAQLDLASYYQKTGDKQQAFYWTEQAARQGDPESAFNTAIAYDTGEGIKKDLQQAAYWYKKSAMLGNPAAAYNLGILYDEGAGVGMDKIAAHTWLKLALLLKNEPEATEQALFKAGFLLRASVIESSNQKAQALLQDIIKNQQKAS